MDWGSIISGFIGGAAAYGAAWLTIRAQATKNRSENQATAFVAARNLQFKLARLNSVLTVRSKLTLFEVVKVITEFNENEFPNFLQESIRSDTRLAKVAFELNDSIEKCLEKPWKYPNPFDWKLPGTATDAQEIVGALISDIEVIIAKLNDITQSIRQASTEQSKSELRRVWDVIKASMPE